MRGESESQAMMHLAGAPDQLVPQDHPIRQIKSIIDRALAALPSTFKWSYYTMPRGPTTTRPYPSIPTFGSWRPGYCQEHGLGPP
jgi:hypothetical protein